MKNIAIPVAEFKASAARAAERQRLNQIATLSALDKAAKLEEIDTAIQAIMERDEKAKLQIEKADLPDEARNRAIDDIGTKQDEEILSLRRQRIGIEIIVTEEERTSAIAELERADVQFREGFGLQQLDQDENAQRNADELAHQDYVDNRKYRYDRAVAYPTTGDQLDAIWKALLALADGQPVPDDARAVADAILKVKADHPAPDQ